MLVRQPKKNNLSTTFNPEPLVVEEKKGSMVTACDGFKSITRNSSLFKVIPGDLKIEGEIKQEKGSKGFSTEQPKDTSQDEEPHLPRESSNLRRSQRQRRLPAKFTDYVRIIY